MQKIIINIKDKKRARRLGDFLNSLDFINDNNHYFERTELKLRETSKRKRKRKVKVDENSFFKYAGVWKKRRITLRSLRNKAWRQN